jgi:hypothetical protein
MLAGLLYPQEDFLQWQLPTRHFSEKTCENHILRNENVNLQIIRVKFVENVGLLTETGSSLSS